MVTRECVLRELLGDLWHGTPPADRFRNHPGDRYLTGPDVPDGERWSTFQARSWLVRRALAIFNVRTFPVLDLLEYQVELRIDILDAEIPCGRLQEQL